MRAVDRIDLLARPGEVTALVGPNGAGKTTLLLMLALLRARARHVFVLGLGMLVVPSLTATSINGDREHGVLATLQTTLLTPADIVIGKFLAAWAISLAFLLAASPFLVWAWIAGGVEIGRMLLAVAVLAFVLAVICALGLMFSALTARTIASAVLAYLSVAALTFGTVIGFLIAMPILSTQQSVRVKVVPDAWFEQHQSASADGKAISEPTPADCVYVIRDQTTLHTERTWWLLALNPFVVVADAAPSRKPVNHLGFEPLQMISDGARTARMGTSAESLNECWPEAPPGAARTRGCPTANGTTDQEAGGQSGQAAESRERAPERSARGLALRLRVPRSHRGRVHVGGRTPGANPSPQAAPRHPNRLNLTPAGASRPQVRPQG